MCDLIKLSSIFTIAPCWVWSRGSTEPPSHMELVETSRWRVDYEYRVFHLTVTLHLANISISYWDLELDRRNGDAIRKAQKSPRQEYLVSPFAVCCSIFSIIWLFFSWQQR